jgi:hypothetical protein
VVIDQCKQRSVRCSQSGLVSYSAHPWDEPDRHPYVIGQRRTFDHVDTGAGYRVVLSACGDTQPKVRYAYQGNIK